jgi:hypothetical protein
MRTPVREPTTPRQAQCTAYGTNLQNFVLALRNHFGQPRLPFVYGHILPQSQNSQGAVNPPLPESGLQPWVWPALEVAIG